jgi:hypothetical protein
MKCLVVLISAMMLASCVGGCQNGTKEMKRPIQSQGTGKLESVLLKEHGKPNETHLYENRKKLIGEMRTPVAREAERLDPGADQRIKELVFVGESSTRFAWLMENDGVWRVFYDLDVPQGVQY